MGYVVTLTGGKNNSGDFLIKKKAHDLLRSVRPDLEIVDINGWEVDESHLNIINEANAVLLTGGPSLIPNMVPAIYSLDSILDEIKVPIIAYGIGWYHANGDWSNTKSFKFNEPTKRLFKKLSSSGYFNSVRDHFTADVLKRNGVVNVSMTGCPVLYNGGNVVSRLRVQKTKNLKVAVSVGVGFKDMIPLQLQIEELLLESKNRFGDITAIFHHSLAKNRFVPGSLSKKQKELVAFLDANGIDYIDISGSAESLIEAYDSFDMHIGYRVHAHLYMLSQGKLSYLIAEDGRGTGQQQVLGEPNFRSYVYALNSKFIRGFHRFGIKLPSKIVNGGLVLSFLNFVSDDLKFDGLKNNCSYQHIRTYFVAMDGFLKNLPGARDH